MLPLGTGCLGEIVFYLGHSTPDHLDHVEHLACSVKSITGIRVLSGSPFRAELVMGNQRPLRVHTADGFTGKNQLNTLMIMIILINLNIFYLSNGFTILPDGSLMTGSGCSQVRHGGQDDQGDQRYQGTLSRDFIRRLSCRI